MPSNQQETHNIQAWSLINRKYLGQGVRVKDSAVQSVARLETVCYLLY